MSDELRAEVERLRVELDKAHKQLTHIYELALTEDGLADFDADSIRDAWMGYVSREELDELREQSKQDTENEIDNDWLSAVQNLRWGFEVNLAEGQEIASEGRREVIESIHSELERVKSEAAVLREALCKFRRTADCYDSGNGVNLPLLEARWVADAALSTTAGSDYVSKAEVRPIWDACQKLLTGLHATALNNPEFHNAYDRARETARKLGLLEDNQ